MTAAPLAVDLSRLWLAGLRTTPRGIERVDHALIRTLVRDWPGELFGLTWTPWGLRFFGREIVERLVGHVETVWREDGKPEDDPVFRQTWEWLHDRASFRPKTPVSPYRHQFRKARRGLAVLRATGIEAGWSADDLPKGTIVASFGHVGLVSPGVGSFLDRRPDLRVCALIHDVISITDPQFFPRANDGYFRRILDRAVSRCDLILTTTRDVEQKLRPHLRARRDGTVPRTAQVDVVRTVLGARPPRTDEVGTPARPFFLVCATWEPRKNHALLLGLWREMAAEMDIPPKLVVIGGYGWGADAVEGTLRRSRRLDDLVARTSLISSPGVFRLMRHARALLAPSFAEGFGLPVAEALSAGTPTVAATIPVFKETTRGLATLVDPLDGPTWKECIQKLSSHDRRSSADRARNSQLYIENRGEERELADLLATLPS